MIKNNIELVTAIIGLITILISAFVLVKSDSTEQKTSNTATVKNNKGTITQRGNTHNDFSRNSYVDGRKFEQHIHYHGNTPETKNGTDYFWGFLLIAVILILSSFFLFQYLWIARLVTIVIQLIIVICLFFGIQLLLPKKTRFSRIMFIFSPIIIVFLFLIESRLNPIKHIIETIKTKELPEINVTAFQLFLKINNISLKDVGGFTVIITFTYLSCFFLVLSQVCALLYPKIKSGGIRKFMENSINYWYLPIAFQSIPLAAIIVFQLPIFLSSF